MNKSLALLIILIFCNACQNESASKEEVQNVLAENLKSNFITDGFDFPVGKPEGEGYYDAQHFGENGHLGEDWNGNGGGDTDLGDPVYAVANGKVSFAEDLKGGWGKVVRIIHTLPSGEQVESLYAHFDEIFVQLDEEIKKGQKIGTIGTADGQYKAHLHFEIREKIGMPLGKGYSEKIDGYVNPSKFIYRNRN
ncbi:murein hydrolase activator EnvC family protein [Moheibacter lacus]|uniref:M23 family metallopeptidase n=1 Tax=Moheibacter lacus TaxID=2745851 RepID=A0A838ZSA1_9FLAO|nr:M23 family metallopeptidase [Moheibacter lacus]MBA5629189.1 M23 family metallopeptidase [Moheibacter lacus]